MVDGGVDAGNFVEGAAIFECGTIRTDSPYIHLSNIWSSHYR